jgi:hypothetical protein
MLTTLDKKTHFGEALRPSTPIQPPHFNASESSRIPPIQVNLPADEAVNLI